MTGSLSYATVPSAPPSDRELDAYREQADRFIAELDEETYLHFAGLKDSYDVVSIYERHANLTELEQAQAIGLAVNGGNRVRELWRFACELYLGNLTREPTQRAAELEATLKATVESEEIPFRMLRPRIANEEDRDARRRLEEARNALTDEHLNPLHLETLRVSHAETEKLGAATYTELYRRFGYGLDELANQARAFLADTEELYEREGNKLFKARVGVGLGEAQRWDVPRLFRGIVWDEAFGPERMLPALESTLNDLGVDLRAQQNVELDLEDRPNKSPRAFCVPIEVPQRVVLVIKPQGGPDDWRALFHEAGHTEHFAHTAAELSVEERRLGDNAVTEGWAILLEHLTSDPVWLSRRLDFPQPREFAAEGAVQLLWLLRRYSAKLIYEIELHQAPDPVPLRLRYAELLTQAMKVPYTDTDYLTDLDSSFYVSEYLRAWAFEAQLRNYLRRTFGNAWFAQRDAGSLLRELWAEGQKHTADELLKDVAGERIELAAVADRIREAL
jgi:hypothetical protein